MQLFYITVLQGLLISISPYAVNQKPNVKDMPIAESAPTCSVIEKTELDNNSLNIEVRINYKKNDSNQFEIVSITSTLPYLDTFLKEKLEQMPLPLTDTVGISEFSISIPLNHII